MEPKGLEPLASCMPRKCSSEDRVRPLLLVLCLLMEGSMYLGTSLMKRVWEGENAQSKDHKLWGQSLFFDIRRWLKSELDS